MNCKQMRTAAGGVVFDADHKRVLLRKPTQNPGFDDLQWTHAKGGVDPGESLEHCAIREVLEEMGIHAQILERIPGTFLGTTSENTYFAMQYVSKAGPFDSETQEVRWFGIDEAFLAMQSGSNKKSVFRDMSVLKKACELLKIPNLGFAWILPSDESLRKEYLYEKKYLLRNLAP
jgi:8-oxo-dGTP pyrophosphatase MutT (NUDIX family)